MQYIGILAPGDLYLMDEPRKIGESQVWDVMEYDYTPVWSGNTLILLHQVRPVGKVVLQGDRMYARDNTACGEPLYLPADWPTLPYRMLRYATGILFR